MTDYADLRRLAEQAEAEFDKGQWIESDVAVTAFMQAADPQRILALLDNLSAALAREDKYRLEADRLVRRVAALEEGLRTLLAADDGVSWTALEEARDKARALLASGSAGADGLAALPAERLRLGQQVAIRSHLPGDLDAMADQISEATDDLRVPQEAGGPAPAAPDRCDRIVDNGMGEPTECGRTLPCEYHAAPAALGAAAAEWHRYLHQEGILVEDEGQECGPWHHRVFLAAPAATSASPEAEGSPGLDVLFARAIADQPEYADGFNTCNFCSYAPSEGDGHAPDCVYPRAARLLRGQRDE